MLKALGLPLVALSLLAAPQDEILGVQEWWGSFNATLKGEFSKEKRSVGEQTTQVWETQHWISRTFSGSFHLDKTDARILLPGIQVDGPQARTWSGGPLDEPVVTVNDLTVEKTTTISGGKTTGTTSNKTELLGRGVSELRLDSPVLAVDTKEKRTHLHFPALMQELADVLGIEVKTTATSTDEKGKSQSLTFEAPGAPSSLQAKGVKGEGFEDALAGRFYKRPFAGGAATLTDTVGITLTIPDMKGSAHLVFTWTMSPKPPSKLELVLKPEQGYDDWSPKAGKDETILGSTLRVTARLREKGETDPEKSPSLRAKSIKFRLLEVSREPGTCINWPATPQTPAAPDLKFEADQNPGSQVLEEGLALEKKEDRLWKSDAVVSTFDWGAYGRLQAVAMMEDGTEVVSVVEGEPGLLSLPIPRSRPGSRIADAWRKREGASGPDDSDDEKDPIGDGIPGDGLTLYQEYRGYHAGSDHYSAKPLKKDYFVIDTIGKPAIKAGIGLFERISELRVESRLEPGQVNADRVINFNRTGGKDQHAILMKMHADPTCCKAYSVNGLPGTPKQIKYVGIAPTATLPLPLQAPAAGKAFEPQAWNDEEWLIRGIAHELLHCCNVYHHGDGKDWDTTLGYVADANGVVQLRYLKGSPLAPYGPPVKLFEESGLPAEWGGRPAEFDVNVGEPHGKDSGYEQCVMRYDNSDLYPRPGQADAFFLARGMGKMGNELCSGAEGVDFNRVPRAQGPLPTSRFQGADAAARRGRCKFQICVNDSAAPSTRGEPGTDE